MRLVFQIVLGLCSLSGRKGKFYIYKTRHEAGPRPGEQRIRLCLQTQRETNPHLLKISKGLWIIINTRYSTAELLQSLSPRATPQPNYFYHHALHHGRTITITIATRYSTAKLFLSPRATPRPSFTITIATRYSTASLLHFLKFYS